jgi:hypothetical protein
MDGITSTGSSKIKILETFITNETDSGLQGKILNEINTFVEKFANTYLFFNNYFMVKDERKKTRKFILSFK